MVMVHVGPFDVAPGAAGWLYRLTYGRASILFVTLAGVGVSLLAGDRSQQRLSRALWQIAWRVAIFLPLGLYLQELDTPVAVILQYYAAYYVVAAAALRLSDRVLLTIIAVWTVVGPVLWLLGDHDRGVAEPGDVLAVASGLWVDGIYPVLTWGPAILFGVWLGRRDLRSTRTRWLLLAGGMGAAAVAYGGSELLRALFGQPVGDAGFDRLLLAEGHSGMPLNIIGAVGVATALLGACLLLTSALPRLTLAAGRDGPARPHDLRRPPHRAGQPARVARRPRRRRGLLAAHRPLRPRLPGPGNPVAPGVHPRPARGAPPPAVPATRRRVLARRPLSG